VVVPPVIGCLGGGASLPPFGNARAAVLKIIGAMLMQSILNALCISGSSLAFRVMLPFCRRRERKGSGPRRISGDTASSNAPQAAGGGMTARGHSCRFISARMAKSIEVRTCPFAAFWVCVLRGDINFTLIILNV